MHGAVGTSSAHPSPALLRPFPAARAVHGSLSVNHSEVAWKHRSEREKLWDGIVQSEWQSDRMHPTPLLLSWATALAGRVDQALEAFSVNFDGFVYPDAGVSREENVGVHQNLPRFPLPSLAMSRLNLFICF